MHEIDADGYIDVGGHRRFVDRSLPTYDGTLVDDQWANAVQEEIIAVLTEAGITPRASGAADETAGWDQLKTAIFNSNAITDAALQSVSLSTLADGTLSIVSGDDFLEMTADLIKYGEDDGTGDVYKNASMSKTGIALVDKNTTSSLFDYASHSADLSLWEDLENEIVTEVDAKGVGFRGINHPAGNNSERFNFTLLDISSSGISFVNSLGTNLWVADADVATGIPNGCHILGVNAYFIDANGDSYTSPCTVKKFGGLYNLEIRVGIFASGATPSFEPLVGDMTLHIMFNGKNLS